MTTQILQNKTQTPIKKSLMEETKWDWFYKMFKTRPFYDLQYLFFILRFTVFRTLQTFWYTRKK